ncbi:TRAP transporter small permease [Paraburkholderia lycopersici]|nr:TRAP transporter small permease [Paraburkholderia lycopersici]
MAKAPETPEIAVRAFAGNETPGEETGESRIDWVCRWVTQLAVIALILMIATEVIARSVFHLSLEVTDELGGYALIVVTFVSLPTCQAQGAFHHVHFLDARLGPLARAVLRAVFSAVSLAAIAILCWQFVLFALTSWQSGDVAATTLLTPLWIPRAIMCFGSACLCLSLCRTLHRDWRCIANLLHGRNA